MREDWIRVNGIWHHIATNGDVYYRDGSQIEPFDYDAVLAAAEMSENAGMLNLREMLSA